MTSTPPRSHAGYGTGDPEYRRIAVALFAAGLATFALLYSTQTLLPELVGAFGVTAAQSTLSLSFTTIGLGVALLVAGPLSEVVGRTPLIHASLTASSLIGLACAVAPRWDVLLLLRLLQGAALAGLPAVATAYLREELHRSVQARAAGLYIGGTALGGMTGRVMSGFVGEHAGWRWSLAAIAALGLACALAVRLLLPRSRAFTPAPARLGHLAGLMRGALTDRALLALYAIGACSMGVFVAVFNAVGFRLSAAPFTLGLGAVGMVFLVYPIGAVSAIVAGRIADRRSRRPVLAAGSAVFAVGLLLTIPDNLAVIVVGLAVMTGGFFAVHGIASGWVPARAYAAALAPGPAASVYLFAYYLGSSVVGGFAGVAWSTGAWPGVMVLTVGLVAVAGGLSLYLRGVPPLSGRRP